MPLVRMVKMRLVQVKWVDSALNIGWKSRYSKETSISKCKTVGYLVKKNKKQLVIAMSVNDSGGYSEAMAIPIECVKSVKGVKTIG